jgi:hypothetical protein
VLEKIERLGEGPILADELDTVFSRTGGGHELVHNTEAFQCEVAVGHKGFPYVVSGKLLFFENKDFVTLFR